MIQFFDSATIIDQEGKTVATVPCQITRPQNSVDPDGSVSVTRTEMRMIFPASLSTWYDTSQHSVRYQGKTVHERSVMYTVRGKGGPEFAAMDVRSPWTLIST